MKYLHVMQNYTLPEAESDVKLLAKINLQDKSLCLNTIHLPLKDTQICAGGGKEDSCKGDSGGPLMALQNLDGVLSWNIIGIISYGFNSPCGSLARPGIYTYVPAYLDWIKETIAANT